MTSKLHQILDGHPGGFLLADDERVDLDLLRAVIRTAVESIHATPPPDLSEVVMKRIGPIAKRYPVPRGRYPARSSDTLRVVS